SYIFITHCHSDHSFNLPMLLFTPKDIPTPVVYVPEEMVKSSKLFINSTFTMNNNELNFNKQFARQLCDIRGVKANQKFIIEIARHQHTTTRSNPRDIFEDKTT
ncbi:MAG: hypothetical protein CUN55_21365, partial [Phototrophicales bacterium]